MLAKYGDHFRVGPRIRIARIDWLVPDYRRVVTIAYGMHGGRSGCRRTSLLSEVVLAPDIL